jgi:hypothetical protein
MSDTDWPKNGSYQDVFDYCEEHDLYPLLTVEQFYEYCEKEEIDEDL